MTGVSRRPSATGTYVRSSIRRAYSTAERIVSSRSAARSSRRKPARYACARAASVHLVERVYDQAVGIGVSVGDTLGEGERQPNDISIHEPDGPTRRQGDAPTALARTSLASGRDDRSARTRSTGLSSGGRATARLSGLPSRGTDPACNRDDAVAVVAAQLNDREVMDLVLTLTEVAEAIETDDELAPTMANELTDGALLLLDRHAEDR